MMQGTKKHAWVFLSVCWHGRGHFPRETHVGPGSQETREANQRTLQLSNWNPLGSSKNILGLSVGVWQGIHSRAVQSDPARELGTEAHDAVELCLSPRRVVKAAWDEQYLTHTS